MKQLITIKQWTSKDSHDTSYISISSIDSSKVVEIESSNILDELLLEFNTAKGRKEKGAVREKYRQAAKELNSHYKQPYYNSEL